MKIKPAFLILIVLFSISDYAFSKDRTLSNGFSAKFILGFPSETYGLEKGDEIPSDLKPGTLLGLQVGNQWYISRSEHFGFGLMANWLDVSYSWKTATILLMDVGRATIDLSFLEFGPVGTVPLSETIAIDAYYNFRPSYLFTAMGNDLLGSLYTGFGITHAIGAGFRYRVLSVGMEYVLGEINAKGVDLNDNSIKLPDAKLNAGNFRLMFGFKF